MTSISGWYNEKVEELANQLQMARGQAEYYKTEVRRCWSFKTTLQCESLLKRTILTLDQNADLEEAIIAGESKNAQINVGLLCDWRNS